jgi:hypothetical protein
MWSPTATAFIIFYIYLRRRKINIAVSGVIYATALAVRVVRCVILGGGALIVRIYASYQHDECEKDEQNEANHIGGLSLFL